MSNKYNETKEITKADFLKIIKSNDRDEICEAIINASFYISDTVWLLEQLSLLINHRDIEVRGATISAIGHLARTNKTVSKSELLGLLRPFLSDNKLSGRAEDAIDDINTFL